MLETFDFETDDDRAVAISLILSAVARRGLPFVPLHGFDAPVAGSGKSMLVDIASIAATGHEAGVTAYGDPEEGEKRLSAILIRGDPIIALDTCEAPLEGVLLNQMLTQHQVELRILGQSRMISPQTKTMPTATGNNLIVKGDLTRRSVIGRLDPRCEQPELRAFPYDPIADAKENRGEIVAAALTVLRAYHIVGKPNKPAPLQSFIPWSDTVRGALLWLGQGDPVKTVTRVRRADPQLAALRAMLSAWRCQFGNEPKTCDALIEAASATYDLTSERRELRNALLTVAGAGANINPRTLGMWLSKNKNRVVNLNGDDPDAEKDEVALEQGTVLHGYIRWKVVNRDGRP